MTDNEKLYGDWECDDCGLSIHNPNSEMCPKCHGQLSYMITEHDEVTILRRQVKNLIKAGDVLASFMNRDDAKIDLSKFKALNEWEKVKVSVRN